ncbi:hypothetical protein [Nocardioides dongkuii]|uniref:hypothetical protein n=1 Tax=Nocardioides dongkuii TaxID=2760089 RepID=UPI0018787F5E|nr:hypothetical protein [Nocardioides dongkuii]
MNRLLERPVDDPAPTGSSVVRRLRAQPVGSASLAGTAGLFVQAVAYAFGWSGETLAAQVFWYLGLVVMVSAFAVLLTAGGLRGSQRLAGSLVFTLLLHASWLLSNPVLAARFDESLHVTTLLGLTQDGWFTGNTMLPVSPHYPGLELAAAGVHWLTGLPLMVCQIVVVLLARTTFVLALFLLATRVGRSSRVGSVVVLLYAASPQFYFFNAQFSYQTVAIALLLAALWFLVQAYDAAEHWPWSRLVGAQVCLAALAVTHHLTSWVTLVTLLGLTLLMLAGSEKRRARLTGTTLAVAVTVTAAWTAVVGPLIARYLGPVFTDAGNELRQVLALDGGGRRILADGGGEPMPTWQVVIMTAAIVLWCLLLLPSGWAAIKGRTLRRTPARWLPLALAAAYPLLPLARFSPSAGEVADRASTFVALGLALVVAMWAVTKQAELRGLVAGGAVVLVVGGTLLGGGPDWQRLPGPYLAGAEQRSVDHDTVAAAQWAGRYLPEGSRIAADTTMDRVMPNFAPVVPVTQGSGSLNVTPVFAARWIRPPEVALLRDAAVDFVVVDTRTAGETVRSGDYFEAGSVFGPDAVTISPESVQKFSVAAGFDLVLDGPVRIYDVRSLRGVPETFADRENPGLPGSWSPVQAVISLLLLLVSAALLLLRGLRGARAQTVTLLSLPVLMLVGVLGVAFAMSQVAGTCFLLAATVGLWSVIGEHTRRLTRPQWVRVLVSPAAASVLLVAGATGIATHAAWEGQLPDRELPPPLVGTAP